MAAPNQPLKRVEFVTLLAVMISILALSIDAILPALGIIAQDLKLSDSNDAQLVITSMFLGFAIGQILAGPLSDIYGRKPIIYVGYIIFITGCLLSYIAHEFWLMNIGRVLQGLGAAAPRIVGIALVRDGYQGRTMAQIMSIVMAIFILVPAVAPAIGQLVMLVAGWREIFLMLLLVAIVPFVWLAMRQPETLRAEDKRKLSLKNILLGIAEALSYRSVLGYTITSGLIFGAFLGYLNSAQQIFQDIYKTGELFAVYFGVASLAIGASSIFNSNLVMRFGMRLMTWRAFIALTILSTAFGIFVVMNGEAPNLWMFMAWLLSIFFCIGIVFGNLNALAMEEVGYMAGLGAAVFGSLSTFISLPLGWAIGVYFDGTLLPLILGFTTMGSLCLIMMVWTDRASNRGT